MNRRALLRTGLTVTAVTAAGTAVAQSTATADGPSVAGPVVYGTGAWGARPPNGTIEVLNHEPTYIIVHHTAGGNSTDYSLAHAFAVSRGIQNFHMDSRGWIDSGQQFTNSRGGHITEGRHRSLEILNGGTRHVMGAHVANNNSVCIGIENEGLYSTVNVTSALWNSLVQLVTYMSNQYGVPTYNIKGHRDFNATECPGQVLYNRLPELRDAVGRMLGTSVVNPMSWPLLKPGDTGAKVLAAQHLLRARGLSVPADGVFGQRTFAAVAGFAATNKIPYEPCYASRVGDESGFVGAPTWPLLVQPVPAGDAGEAGKAARVLLTAKGENLASTTVVDEPAWQRLLN